MTYHCKLCKGHPAYPDVSSLRTHQWEKHRSHYERVGHNFPRKTDPKPEVIDIPLLVEGPVKCDVCLKMLKNKATLGVHMRGVHGIFKGKHNGNGEGNHPEPDNKLYAVQVQGLLDIAEMIRDLSERKDK